MRTVWFMTGNVGKVREAKHALEPLGFNVQQLVIEGVDISEPQCDDLEIVARSKLEQARVHLPNQNDGLMVEDAGLFVEIRSIRPSNALRRWLNCSFTERSTSAKVKPSVECRLPLRRTSSGTKIGSKPNGFQRARRHHRHKQGVLGWSDRHGVLTQHNRTGVCCNLVVLLRIRW